MKNTTPTKKAPAPKNVAKARFNQFHWAVNEQVCDQTGELEDIKGRVVTCLLHNQWPDEVITASIVMLPEMVIVRPDTTAKGVKTAFVKPEAEQMFSQKILPLWEL